MTDNVLLTVDEMYQADARTIAGGVPGLDLMEVAGTAIAREIRRRRSPRPVAILCGPGNNGGDGFVVARLLKAAGWPVRVALLGKLDQLKGDAAANARRWDGEVELLAETVLDGCQLVVDALFGAGLTKPLKGIPRALAEAINERDLDCIAVDIPSGVHGDTGQVLGAAPRASLTVTFFRPKPGHFLLPGRDLCGELVVADIGIADIVLADIGPAAFINAPGLWLHRLPWPEAGFNKYSRGHAVVVGGAEMTGAARLAAQAARRAGAGLVTIAAPPEAFTVYASGAPGTLVKPVADSVGLAAFLADARRNAVLVGPGCGVTERTRDQALAALAARRTCVLDADALSIFAADPETLFSAIDAPCLLTPHEGEYARLFADGGSDKISRARHAAQRSGAVVLLKGADTVIATPDGRAVINANAPSELATAGSGDVLAGLALGLIAQGMDVFDAACAATWIHGAAAGDFGPGLIAEDLLDVLPGVLHELKNQVTELPRTRP